MILSTEQIKNILTADPNGAVVDYAQKMRKDLFVHVFGDGLSEYIKQINNFENDSQYQARKQYGRSNKDIMERLTRPLDKVFSAAGGSTFYDLPEKQNREFRNRLKNTENGLPLRKWIEQYWKSAYLADPMGIIFIEIDENGDAYPTYKGSNEIKAYRLNGRHLDYVIFNVEKDAYSKYIVTDEEKTKQIMFYRVVDDEKDIIIKYDGEVSIIEEETYTNHFGHVPAIINSDLPKIGTINFVSPLERIIEIANEYLRECSVKSVYKLLHGFPKYWEYQSVCSDCKGTGLVSGEKCKSCKGTGIKLSHDVSDIKLLPIPTENDKSLAPYVGGYIVPPIEAWTRMNEELKDLETLMFTTLWGTEQLKNGENNTATGKFIDTQPVNERLSKFSDAAEVIETFITDNMAFLYYGNSYKGCSVSYGRRFIIESPDTLWVKYQNARNSGASVSALDDMLKEYLSTKFENHSIELHKQLKLIELEPFVHLSVMQVQALNITGLDKAKKLYFEDFIRTLTDNEIISESRDALNKRLAEYAKERETLINEQNINNQTFQE
ncbi:MAG: hypothetical protein LBK94_13440 [Prevotellaceae bacterium]|jgi:hypothetical protein|nr:hypothetical protein [Prevotellaceae bacterium]